MEAGASGEGNRVRRQKGVRWWRMCQITELLISFGTYNILNGCNRGLELVLRGISQVNMDLGIFQ